MIYLISLLLLISLRQSKQIYLSVLHDQIWRISLNEHSIKYDCRPLSHNPNIIFENGRKRDSFIRFNDIEAIDYFIEPI